MTKKKIAYIGAGIVALVLGYFNYFGSDKETGDIRKLVETINAVYESDDLRIEAEKQVDYIDEKESKFEKAKAFIQGMLLSGDNAFLDKDRNLTLDTNIIGKSANGWEIKASQLKYNKETQELESVKPMYAKNEEKGIEVLGNKFKTTVSMDNITLEDGVVIKNKLFSIVADKANYNNEAKTITLEGNIALSNKIGEIGDINTLTDVRNLQVGEIEKGKEMSGTFSKVYFNLNERNLYATDGFDMKYGEIGLKGRDIVLNETDQSFKVTGDVKFTYQDYVFDVNYIEKEANSDIINVYGQIKGGNPDESSVINGNSITYNKKTGELTSPGDIVMNNKGTIMKGHDLVFNNITGVGKLQGPIPFENKEDKMSGTAKEIIIKRGEYVDLMGPVRVKQDTTNMVVDKARYSYKDELVHVNTPVKFDDPVRSMVGSVSSATYSPKDGILRGSDFNMREPNRTAKAQNIVLYNKENRRLELVGNAYLSSGADSITGPKIIYYLDTKDAETPTNSVIKYDQYTIKSSYGKVNKESGEIFVKNADVKSVDGNEFYSNQAKGNINDVVHFTGNVKGKSKQKEGDVYFSGDKADLYMAKIDDKYQAKKVIVNTKSTFTQLNRKIVSNYMELDLIKKEVYAKDKPVLTIDDGPKGNTLVKADDVTGYIDQDLIKLNKNVYVKNVNEKKEEVVLTADRGAVTKKMADVYDRVKVVTKDSVTTANEGHYDMENRKIRAKGNVHVEYQTDKSAGNVFDNMTSTNTKKTTKK